ncbi:uncharacterized protein LOC142240664 isoform X2 [Haematobia irritans]|uniref:uncharacterized protein LOC142240664 isoform X2 n=1 Tax=Haematobia irritans TaxID=7368 RepID=UPI003F4FB480
MLKKYNEKMSKGEKEEPYCPKRKYFESLMFLKDEETQDKRSKQENFSEPPSTNAAGRNSGKNSESIRLMTETTDSGSVVEIIEVDKSSNSGASANVDDSLQVPNNLFSEICKEINKENNDNEPDEDTNIEEVTPVSVSVISDKVDIEEMVTVTPIRKDQVFVIENTATTAPPPPSAVSSNNNSSSISPQKQQNQQLQNTSKSRKRSSSFSSQHSNETTDTTPTPVKTSKSDVTFDIENLLSLACKTFQKNTVDHHTSFGEIVAYKLRTMDATQALYAEKIISDILYQGHMKYLSPAAIQRCSNLERLQTQEK